MAVRSGALRLCLAVLDHAMHRCPTGSGVEATCLSDTVYVGVSALVVAQHL